MTRELRIYGVQFYFNKKGRELDNYEIEMISADDFMDRAEEEGNVWTLMGFLRFLEEIAYGFEHANAIYNMTLRAYLVPTDLSTGEEVMRADDSIFLLDNVPIKTEEI